MLNVTSAGILKDLPKPNASGTQITFVVSDKQAQKQSGKTALINRETEWFCKDLWLIQQFTEVVNQGDLIVISGEIVLFKDKYLFKMQSFEIIQKVAKEVTKEGQF